VLLQESVVGENETLVSECSLVGEAGEMVVRGEDSQDVSARGP